MNKLHVRTTQPRTTESPRCEFIHQNYWYAEHRARNKKIVPHDGIATGEIERISMKFEIYWLLLFSLLAVSRVHTWNIDIILSSRRIIVCIRFRWNIRNQSCVITSWLRIRALNCWQTKCIYGWIPYQSGSVTSRYFFLQNSTQLFCHSL